MRNRKSLWSEKTIDLRWRGLLLGRRSCARCGGLLTRDEECALSRDGKLPAWRCIQCGDWLDEIVLRNRVATESVSAA